MIPRYSRPAMTALWEPENRFRIWFEIEAHACDALAEAGIIPKSAAQTIRAKGKWEIDRIDAIEREIHHDVVAFLTNLAEHIGPDARFLHQGMTSSDVLDTCLAVQLREGIERAQRVRRRMVEHQRDQLWSDDLRYGVAGHQTVSGNDRTGGG